MIHGIDFDTIMTALGLTLVAGMSTGIGSLMAFFTSHTDKKFLSCALGLSAGVMIYVSFMDLLPMAIEEISSGYAGKTGMLYVLCGFFGGIGLIAAIDMLVPEDENPHEVSTVEEMKSGSNLRRTGLMLAGAIAIHNIPEGIAVSVPIYHATGNRRKALMWSLMSGLAEPLGAIFGLAFLLPFWTPTVGAIVMAAVAGIMVYISIDELLPGSERYGHHHLAMCGVIGGMVLMAFSLLLF